MITRWLNENSMEYVIAFTYASGKGRLFEMFFGWRETNKDGNCKMIFSKKDWEKIDSSIEYYHKFIEKNNFKG